MRAALRAARMQERSSAVESRYGSRRLHVATASSGILLVLLVAAAVAVAFVASHARAVCLLSAGAFACTMEAAAAGAAAHRASWRAIPVLPPAVLAGPASRHMALAIHIGHRPLALLLLLAAGVVGVVGSCSSIAGLPAAQLLPCLLLLLCRRRGVR